MIFGVAVAARSGILSSLGGLIYIIVGLAVFVGMVIAAIKAFQGEIFKLPVIGDLADKWSN